MGNTQTNSIVNQLLPMDAYVLDVPELRFIKSLGATRFMKTACAEHRDGLSVIKLFVYGDQELNTDQYIDQVASLRRRLRDSPNCLPFLKQTEKCVILQRPFGKFTLYDRLSTRPFLLDVEKRWLAFQMLKVLAQLRMSLISHGDIKTQNILVSSANWVQLTDFAPFKPAFDNPSAFTFFFDTSRRRTCYLSPERFKRAEDLAFLSKPLDEVPRISDGLTHAMDIFAMGCALVELLTDGRHMAFNLSQAVDYTRLDEHVTHDYLQKLLSVCPEDFAPLLSAMLARDPEQRKRDFEQLCPCHSDLFPPLFESYLYNYLKELHDTKDPDQVIVKLYVEFPNYEPRFEADRSGAVVLLISVVTSNIRACRSMSSKMDAMVLLKKLCKLTDAAVITDRIVPYLVCMLSDYFAQVRGEAVFVVTDVLCRLESVPQDESRLLVDYVFQRLKQLTEDRSDFVKAALASCLGRLAATSLRFFEESLAKLREEAHLIPAEAKHEQPFAETVEQFGRTERAALQEAVSRIFVNLSDSSNAVRECLFAPENLSDLCAFFGSSKSADADVLMHMIALLNDKHDWQLRAAFFRSCTVVAALADPMQNSTLVPFLQQGLQDVQEFVTLQTLRTLCRLCNGDKLEKAVVTEIVKETVPFLVHPNKWFRVQVVNLLCILDSAFSIADVYCKLMPLVRPYLTESLIRMNERAVVRSCLVPPIPRQAWDFVVGLSDIPGFMHALLARRTLDKLGGGRYSMFSAGSGSPELSLAQGSGPLDGPTDVVFKKLANLGLTVQVEDQLLSFDRLFNKIAQSKKRERGLQSRHSLSRILLKDLPGVRPRAFDLENGIHKITTRSSAGQLMDMSGDLITSDDDERLGNSGSPPGGHVGSSRALLLEALSHKRQRYMEQKRVTNRPHRPRDAHDAKGIPLQLGDVLNSSATMAAMANAMASTRAGSPTAISRPELRLQAHLHEHGDAVLKLAAHPHREFFASCSADKTVKLWSASQLSIRGTPAVVSIETLPYTNRINSLHFTTDSNAYLIMGSSNCELYVHDTAQNRLLRSCALGKEEEGQVVQVHASEHLAYALTHHSSVFCFDLRSNNSSQKVALDALYSRRARNSCGLITGFTLDPGGGHWLVLTASSSTTTNIVLWDLRFGGLEVASWSHPSQHSTPFRSWPFVSSGAESCSQILTNSARDGELSLWDLGTKYRSDVLWPAPTPPLSYTSDLVTSAVVSCPEMDGIFTGDSEGSLRYWNLKGSPHASNYLSGPYRRLTDSWLAAPTVARFPAAQKRPPRFEYGFVEGPAGCGARIQAEDRATPCPAEPDLLATAQVSECHRDAITDLIALGSEQLISAGRDGVIKVWKTALT